jgi:hypothetical protein
MTPTRTRADNFVRHQIERFRGNDDQWATRLASLPGKRIVKMIDKLEAEFFQAFEDQIKERLSASPSPAFIKGFEDGVRMYEQRALQRACLGPIVHSEERGFDHIPLMTNAEMYPKGRPETGFQQELREQRERQQGPSPYERELFWGKDSPESDEQGKDQP